MPNELKSSPISSESLARKHEVSEKSVRNVLIVGGASAFLLIFSLAACGLAFHLLSEKRAMQWMPPLGIISAPNSAPLKRFPAPNLDLDDDHAQRVALYTKQSQKLNSYGWVDQRKGIFHIPIERAMDLISQRGFPSRTNGVSGTDGSPLRLIQEIHENK